MLHSMYRDELYYKNNGSVEGNQYIILLREVIDPYRSDLWFCEKEVV